MISHLLRQLLFFQSIPVQLLKVRPTVDRDIFWAIGLVRISAVLCTHLGCLLSKPPLSPFIFRLTRARGRGVAWIMNKGGEKVKASEIVIAATIKDNVNAEVSTRKNLVSSL